MPVEIASGTREITPADAQGIAAALREADANRHTVIPVGGGTKQHIDRATAAPDVLLRTSALTQIHHYDAGDLTVGVGAGVTLAQLQKVLREQGQFLPLDPMLPESATIGGLLATNSFGPMKAGYGGIRDFCIGIEFATAAGQLAKGGGKVVKNVAGYDLMKLLIGSHGTLGVITSANFKVYPRPAVTRTFLLRFPTIEEVIECRDRLRATFRQSYMAMEVISPRAHEYLEEHIARDPDVYAPAHPVRPVAHWSLALRVAGSGAVVDRYRRELRGGEVQELEDDADFWRRLSDFEVTVTARHRNAMTLYVSAPLSEVADVLRQGDSVAPEYTMLSATVGRVTTGNLVVCFMPLAVDPPSAVAFSNAVSTLRGRLSRDVSVMAARCPEESKLHFDVWGATPTDIPMMAAVKRALDPNHILNRGRFIVG